MRKNRTMSQRLQTPLLFNNIESKSSMITTAEFSECRKYRYQLSRIWDEQLPRVMFIGLNPSTANEISNDRTVTTVERYAKGWGFGGVYMMNSFAYVSTDPKQLVHNGDNTLNNEWLLKTASLCKLVVFAFGNFKILRTTGRDKELLQMFPDAHALHINKNGSPHHPLYLPSDIVPVPYCK